MQFNASEFRKALLNQTTATYYKTFIRPLKRGEEASYQKWFSDVFQQLSLILGGGAEEAELAVRACKFILSLILIGQVDICNAVGSILYPTIYKVSQFDRHKPLKDRGADYYLNKQQPKPRQTHNEGRLRRLGMDFVRFALESIKMWAIWIPESFTEPIHLSRYSTGFRKLKANGLTFPQEEDLVFYSNRNVDATQKRIQQLQIEVFQQGSFIEGDPDNSTVSKYRAYQRSVGHNSYFKPFVKSSTMRSSLAIPNLSIKIDDQEQDKSTSRELPKLKHIVEKLEGEVSQLTSLNKSLNDEIGRLNEEILSLRKELERYRIQQNASIGNILSCENLKDNDLNFTAQFKKSNPMLKTAVSSLPRLEQIELEQVKPIDQLLKQNNELKLLVLKDLAQKSELSSCLTTSSLTGTFPVDHLYKFIGPEQQIRYRKGILKQKQILFQNNFLQVGCIVSPVLDTNKVLIKIVLSNVMTTAKLLNLSCRLVNLSADTAIRSRQVSGVTLFPSGQEKIECEAVVAARRLANIRMCISCSTETGDLFQKILLVPLCKLKFITFQEPNSENTTVFAYRQIKTGQLQEKIMPNMSSLTKFIPAVKIVKGKEECYSVGFQFMGGRFMLKVLPEPESSMTRLELLHKNFNQQANAKDILNEFAFVLLKG